MAAGEDGAAGHTVVEGDVLHVLIYLYTSLSLSIYIYIHIPLSLNIYIYIYICICVHIIIIYYIIVHYMLYYIILITYISLSLSLSLSIYVYIYIHTYDVIICTYIIYNSLPCSTQLAGPRSARRACPRGARTWARPRLFEIQREDLLLLL